MAHSAHGVEEREPLEGVGGELGDVVLVHHTKGEDW